MKFDKQKLKKYGINGLSNKDLIGVLKYKYANIYSHIDISLKKQVIDLHDLQDIFEIIDCLQP